MQIARNKKILKNMTRFKIIITLIFFKLTTLNAQDIIILNNTDEIKSKVIEILDDQVKYKKWTNLNGPSYSIDKSEIFMIKYANGEKETFKNVEKKETKEPKNKVAIAEPIIIEKLENICLKVNKKVIYENEKIEVENCSKDGSSFQLETGDGETTEIALNESIVIPFKKAGVYTIRLTAYTKNKKVKKVVTEEITVMGRFDGAWDIRIGNITTLGDFGDQNYWGSNTTSAVTGGLALEYNADFYINELVKFRTLINYNSMTFKPNNDYSDPTASITENQYNSIKSFFLGVGVLSTTYNSNKRFYSEAGLSLGWFGLNPNNQYFNFYYPQSGSTVILGLEPTGMSNGFGFQINTDFGYKLSKNFDLFIATDFFHSSVTEEFNMVFFINGTKSSSGEKLSSDKSVNFFKQTLGIRFNY